MEMNGFAISRMSRYSVVRIESRIGSSKKPFAPSDPYYAKTNSEAENFSKPKITSPITGKCYYPDDHDYDDHDYRKHEAYPMKGGDEWRDRPKSPAPGSPGKAPNEASRPQRPSPLAATDMRHSAQPKPYGSGNGYGDFGGNEKEERKPIGSTNRNNGSYGSYDDSHGPGSPSKVPNEASRPQRPSPLAPTDMRLSAQPKPYGNANGYGDYGGNDKEERKPIGITNRNSGGYGSYDDSYGNNNNNKGRNLPISPTRRGEYDDHGDNRNKEGYKPSIKDYGGYGSISSPTRSGEYDGADKGYGDYNNKERYKPTISPIWNGQYDGANKDNDGYGNYNKERYNPISTSPARNGNYGSRLPPAENKPKIGTSWTSSPRKGGQLISQATNDIEKVLELMREAAVNDHTNRGRPKPIDHDDSPVDEDENYSRNYDGVDRSAPRNSNWAASLGNDYSRLGEARGRFENGGLVGSPRPHQSSVLKDGIVSNKNDYGKSIERKDGSNWNNGKFSLSSKPQTPITHVIDGREANYRTRAMGPIINSNLVEKIGGTRI